MKFHLQFQKTEYLVNGKVDEGLMGSRFVVDMQSTQVGWLKFKKGKILKKKLGFIGEGHRPLERIKLGNLKEKKWLNGIDPWRQAITVTLRKLETEDQYWFVGSSMSSRNTVMNLCRDYGNRLDDGETRITPLISLETDFYSHKIYGKIYVPVLEIRDWL